MAWRNWSYWLRGGIIAVVVAFLIGVIIGIGYVLFESSSSIGVIGGFLFNAGVIVVALIAGKGVFGGVYILPAMIISLLAWFIIGVIIGAIYGKNKQNGIKGN